MLAPFQMNGTGEAVSDSDSYKSSSVDPEASLQDYYKFIMTFERKASLFWRDLPSTIPESVCAKDAMTCWVRHVKLVDYTDKCMFLPTTSWQVPPHISPTRADRVCDASFPEQQPDRGTVNVRFGCFSMIPSKTFPLCCHQVCSITDFFERGHQTTHSESTSTRKCACLPVRSSTMAREEQR